jgi:phage terminase large subunit-like protein
MDQGTALAIVGLGLDAVKDLHLYYVVLKNRDRDMEEIRQQLIWFMNPFQTIQITLKQDGLNPAQV